MFAAPRFKAPIEIDPEARTLKAVITTADPDRSGDVIRPQGLSNLTEFLKNPVVLWAHQRTLPPIGTCIDLQVFPDRIVAVTKFASGVPFAEDVFRLYSQGILRGWSIGLVPKSAAPTTHNGRRSLRIESWDLLEYSAVPVPENPKALTLAVREGVISDACLRDWLVSRTDPFEHLVA